MPASISFSITAGLAEPNLPVFLPSVSSTFRPCEQGDVRIVGAVGIDRVWHLLVAVRLPDLIVVRAVAGRGVDKAGAGVVGDVVARQQRHGEAVAVVQRGQRVGALQTGRVDVIDAGPSRDLRRL